MEKMRAIVLRAVKYGENQIVVDFFTESYGRLAFMIRLPKTSSGKNKRQYFQPSMILNIEFDFRPKKDLQTLKNVSIAFPYLSLPFSFPKITISLFLAEFLTYVTRCEQSNLPLFEFVCKSFMWLDAAKSSIANFHIVFLLRLSLFLGFEPDVTGYSEQKYFDLQEGCFVDHVPTHAHFLSIQDSYSLVQLLRLGYKTMHLYTMSRQERYHCVEVIVGYYRLHVPSLPEIKSLPILRDLFD